MRHVHRAVAIAFAKEGADVAIAYLDEHEDARDTRRQVEEEGRRCRAVAGDVGEEAFCTRAVEETVKTFGRLDIPGGLVHDRPFIRMVERS